MTEKQRSLLPAIFLILLGGWFLLNNFGVSLPGIESLWPGFIIFGGLWQLWTWFKGDNRHPNQIFSGLSALGIGGFFFLFTLNLWIPVIGRVNWSDMAQLWPGFIIIVGASWLGQFVLTGFKDKNALGWGVLALAVGAIAFGFTLNLLSPSLGKLIAQYWPLILIVIGLGILLRSRKQRD